ncbi:MAG: radical SAM protein [Deltaproteobacteria bacterium]|nr:radical SAM protein [Deltaproteobacteria bacterium]
MNDNLPELLNTPKRITVELTNHCNLSCEMCPRHYMQYPKGFMTKRLFHKLVDEMSDSGIPVMVPFFRGESLLHPEFLDYITYAKKKDLTIQLATNGVLLTETTARKLIELGLDFISFSVDSIDEEHYRTIRKGSDFNELYRAIKSMLREKDRLNSSLPVIQVSAVDTGLTKNTVEDFVSHWNGKVQRVRIYPQHTKDGEYGSLENTPSIPRQPCHKPFTEMVIYWDGKAALCNHDWDRREPLSDAAVHGLLDIWQSDAYKQIRKQHLTGEFDVTDVCRTCGHWAQYYVQDKVIGELYNGGLEDIS